MRDKGERVRREKERRYEGRGRERRGVAPRFRSWKRQWEGRPPSW